MTDETKRTTNHDIERHTIKTKYGNYLSIFFNRTTGLFVVDIVRADERGGNEFIRRTIDDKRMLPSDGLLAELEAADRVRQELEETGELR